MPQKLATNTTVDRSGLLDFLRPRQRVILITTRRDGSPQGSPVTAGVDAAGRLVTSTYPERAKAANARRNAAGSAPVLSDDWNGEWVQVWGPSRCSTSPTPSNRWSSTTARSPVSTPTGTSTARPWSPRARASCASPSNGWGPIATGGFPAHLVIT